MFDFTLKNIIIYTVKMSNIECVGSQGGPENSHISLTLELLNKLFLLYFEISRNDVFHSRNVALYFEKSLNLYSQNV